MIEKRACDGFFGTTLRAALDELGIARVVVTGYATEACVDTTTRRALSEGFDVVLAADAHTTGDWDKAVAPAEIVAHHNRTLPQLAHPTKRVELLPAAEIEF